MNSESEADHDGDVKLAEEIEQLLNAEEDVTMVSKSSINKKSDSSDDDDFDYKDDKTLEMFFKKVTKLLAEK